MNNTNKIFKFTSGWVSGFTQSDGCFTIAFDKRKSGLGIRPKPIFVLTQDISELHMFKQLHYYLGIGYITSSKKNVSLYITNLSAISQVLIPIFEENPLKYGKLASYLIFKQIVNMMLNKEHLVLKNLLAIIEYGFYINKETTRRGADSKINLLDNLRVKPGLLPDIENINPPFLDEKNKEKLTLDFITGLIDGDGSFNVSFQYKPYHRVRVNFTVVQETSCRQVLNDLKEYFACGKVYDLPSATSRYQVENVDLILNKIAPILNKVIFNTKKADSYNTLIKVSELIKYKGYKSKEDFLNIIELSYDSNKLGIRRFFTKQEFIAKIFK